jgi:hypothetical protein
MKIKYCSWEEVFAFIWNNADEDGIWHGDSAGLAQEFSVTRDEAYEVLSELCDKNLIEDIGSDGYAIVRWPERDGRADEEIGLAN